MKKKVSRKWILPVLGVLLACMIGGCGDGGVQETAAQAGAVSPEDTAQAEAADTADNAGGADETAENAQAQTEDIIIDEETKEELTTQLLEENELDTSIIENMVKTRGCTFTLPEGFTEVEDIPGMYVTKRYPIDASTIYYVEMDKDISMQLMTEETFLTQTQNNFEQIYGTDVGLDLKSYEKMEIDGYPAFRILCTYTVDDVEITQMEYVINADKSYVVTYSQTSEYDRMEEFEASAATIHLTF
ncbi:MAG: hypothetical protein NC231_04760 [Bacillus sp. (in: Bacteria)]|nr:hypothetical protein [Bacillus sp. (in: firmicutes)]MCM1426428.1 hypothetical protein [Eubacterium sp.]